MRKPFDLASMRRALAGKALVGFDTAGEDQNNTLGRANPSGPCGELAMGVAEMTKSGHVKLGGVKVGGTKQGTIKSGSIKNGS